MKFSYYLCGIILLVLFGVLPVAATIPGIDIPVYSPYITEDDADSPNYTYSDAFTIDEDQLVWEKYRREQAKTQNIFITVYLLNLTDGVTRILATSPSAEYQYTFETPLGIADGRVVWCEDFSSNIHVYDDRVRVASPLTTDGTNRDLRIQRANRNPFIFGDQVIWVKQKLYPSGEDDIVLYNLTTRNLRDVVTAPGKKATPSMDSSYIVWVDKRNDLGAGDIYLFDLKNNTESPLCTAQGLQHYPQVSGNYVVWGDLRDKTSAVYLYNLTTKMEYRISDLSVYAGKPYLSGNYVAWETYALYDQTMEKSRQVVVYNIATGERWLFEPGTRHPMLLGLTDNRILYANPDTQTIKDGYVHIFVIDTPTPDQLPQVSTTPSTQGDNTPVQEDISYRPLPSITQSGTIDALPLAGVCVGLILWIRKRQN
ncbi:MAG: hypothetical protein WC342_01800 [Methanoregula sp.]|jgi:beta propeller repeat protein